MNDHGDYECPICRKPFQTRDEMLAHRADCVIESEVERAATITREESKAASGFQVYKCPKCHKSFPTEALLAQHYKKVHKEDLPIQTPPKPAEDTPAEADKEEGFECPICHKMLPTKRGWGIHKKLAHKGAPNPERQATFQQKVEKVIKERDMPRFNKMRPTLPGYSEAVSKVEGNLRSIEAEIASIDFDIADLHRQIDDIKARIAEMEKKKAEKEIRLTTVKGIIEGLRD